MAEPKTCQCGFTHTTLRTVGGPNIETYDIAIVGAGPAGLSAALYCARYCRRTLVLHDGTARASRIPLTHNAPGFDVGIAGTDLLERMTRHAQKFGAQLVKARVVKLTAPESQFLLEDEKGAIWSARAVILATGLELNQIPLDDEMHETAIANGVLRYCPVCDGFEHKGARIAVLGCDISGAAEALFLSTYSDDVTLLPRREVELTREEQRDLGQAGIKVVSEAVSRFEPTKCEMRLHFEDQPEPLAFDVLYPALGCRPRSGLARQLGLAIEESGKVAATAPLGTEIPGLFCAGDVVDGLDQISVAMGHGAIAATKAHNWLRASDGDTVEAVLDLDGGNTAHG